MVDTQLCTLLTLVLGSTHCFYLLCNTSIFATRGGSLYSLGAGRMRDCMLGSLSMNPLSVSANSDAVMRSFRTIKNSGDVRVVWGQVAWKGDIYRIKSIPINVYRISVSGKNV